MGFTSFYCDTPGCPNWVPPEEGEAPAHGGITLEVHIGPPAFPAMISGQGTFKSKKIDKVGVQNVLDDSYHRGKSFTLTVREPEGTRWAILSIENGLVMAAIGPSGIQDWPNVPTSVGEYEEDMYEAVKGYNNWMQRFHRGKMSVSHIRHFMGQLYESITTVKDFWKDFIEA
jgi:hypothetical protein